MCYKIRIPKGNTPMLIIYDTERLQLITPDKLYLDSILDYHKRNKEFLEMWEPKRPETFLTRAYQKKWIKEEQKEIKKLTGACFLIVKASEPGRVIGSVKLTNILYGNFCSAFLGYRLDKDETCKGYMTDAVNKMLEIAFDDLNLHRVEASVIPSNEASKGVMRKCGFKYIGTSDSYLKINGDWQPHEMYEFINPSDL